MLKLENIDKYYGPKQVLFEINFDVGRGEVIGLLGPNGAGKTTIMRIITGFLEPENGKVYIDSQELSQNDSLKSMIGYLPETNPLYLDMGVDEFLAYSCDLKGIKNKKIEVARVIDLAGLKGKEKSFINTLSKGYKQRVGLAAALVGDPQILVLDEPTEGLDPAQRDEIKSLINKLGEQKTILISSHVLGEIANIVSRVLIISEGKGQIDDSVENVLMIKDGKLKLNILYEGDLSIEKITDKFKIEESEFSKSGSLNKLELVCPSDIRKDLFNEIKNKIDVYEFYSTKFTLEDVFFDAVKNKNN